MSNEIIANSKEEHTRRCYAIERLYEQVDMTIHEEYNADNAADLIELIMEVSEAMAFTSLKKANAVCDMDGDKNTMLALLYVRSRLKDFLTATTNDLKDLMLLAGQDESKK